MFAIVVTCKKEDGSETTVDQSDVGILVKLADAVVQTKYVCEELSTKRFEVFSY